MNVVAEADAIGRSPTAATRPLVSLRSISKTFSNGTLALNSDGSFTYTHDGSANLSDSFAYQACDPSLACSVAKLTVAVCPPAAATSMKAT